MAQHTPAAIAPPPLPYLPPAGLTPEEPTQRVFTSDDVPLLFQSVALERVALFIARASEAVVGRRGMTVEEGSEEIRAFVGVLDVLERWVDEIPLHTNPQRFGNTAFRDWGRRLEQEARRLHEAIVSKEAANVLPELLHHFVRSFGNWTRLDYGTGHELSFVSYLTLLHLTHLIRPSRSSSTDASHTSQPSDPTSPISPTPSTPDPTPLEPEAQSVLVLYVRYLSLCARLQTVYRLEPAGSRGVHGLDDFFHIGWGWAAAQLRDHPTLKPSLILSRPTSWPSTLTSPTSPPLLIALLLRHLHALKKGGPLSEHSPLLYSIGSTVPTFSKLQKGVERMWRAEVVGKEVVVQHWWLTTGGGLCWRRAGDGGELPVTRRREGEEERQGATGSARAPWVAGGATQAPWAAAGGGTQAPSRGPS